MFSTKPWLASWNNTLVFFPWLHELEYNEITWVKLCVASQRPSVFPPKGTTNNQKADPSWTLLFSVKVIKTTWKCWHFKDKFAFYWPWLLPEMFVVIEREARTWSNCAGGSLTLLFYLWTVQRQKSSVVVFPYAVPSFIIYSSNLLSMEIQAHGSRTLFIVGFLICLNEGFSTIINV